MSELRTILLVSEEGVCSMYLVIEKHLEITLKYKILALSSLLIRSA